MITGYGIKKIDNENVLILYLDYDNELGMDFRKDHKNSNMKKEIKDFIKKNKIEFNGKILLSFGGIILASLLLVESPNEIDDFKLTYVSDNIISNSIVEVIKPNIEDVLENKNEVVLDDIVSEEINNNQNSGIVDSNQNNNSNNQSGGINSTQNSNSNSNISNDSPSIEQEKEDVVLEKQVTVYRSNGSVITLSMDEYLIGVVGAEMPASFSIEALKAQAVVARTYALKKIESGSKLTDSVSTQRYKDNNELRSDWGKSFDTYYQKVKQAVLETKDLEIYYQGSLIDAVYHSTSNGKTEDSIFVWGNDIPYLKSVDSSWDQNASSYLRNVNKDFNNVLSLLGIDIRDDINIEIISRNNSGRVLEIKVGDKIFSGVQFRNLLGLRSSDFDLSLENGILNITTRGYGHGVGMSQYGANGMAKQGYTFDSILKHYYTGINIY